MNDATDKKLQKFTLICNFFWTVYTIFLIRLFESKIVANFINVYTNPHFYDALLLYTHFSYNESLIVITRSIKRCSGYLLNYVSDKNCTWGDGLIYYYLNPCVKYFLNPPFWLDYLNWNPIFFIIYFCCTHDFKIFCCQWFFNIPKIFFLKRINVVLLIFKFLRRLYKEVCGFIKNSLRTDKF